jgi:hypothetical protein
MAKEDLQRLHKLLLRILVVVEEAEKRCLTNQRMIEHPCISFFCPSGPPHPISLSASYLATHADTHLQQFPSLGLMFLLVLDHFGGAMLLFNFLFLVFVRLYVSLLSS